MRQRILFPDATNRSGIYGIFNSISGRVYVGKTHRFRDRWIAHRNELLRGTHPTGLLQLEWKLYPESSFTFCVLEEMGDKNRVRHFWNNGKEREYYHMAVYFDRLYNTVYPLSVPTLAAQLRAA